jgi:hypothetical protein
MTPHQAALNAMLSDLLADPARLRAMGEAAKAHADAGDHKAQAALDALNPLLPGAPA